MRTFVLLALLSLPSADAWAQWHRIHVHWSNGSQPLIVDVRSLEIGPTSMILRYADGRAIPVSLRSIAWIDFQVPTTPPATRVEPEPPAVATTFRLHPSFPNPFNPSTTVTYEVYRTASVDLFIADVQGRRVRTLLRDHQQPGQYRVLWNGLDDAGQRVATGTYLAVLRDDASVVVHKLLLLK